MLRAFVFRHDSVSEDDGQSAVSLSESPPAAAASGGPAALPQARPHECCGRQSVPAISPAINCEFSLNVSNKICQEQEMLT